MGGYGKDITGLTNYTVVNSYSDATQDSSTLTTTGFAYLPSDKFTSMPSNVCPSIKYCANYTSWIAPSPYKVIDGEWLPNEDYYTTRVSSSNALSDFEGLNNTKIITDNATAEDWKSIIPITNSSSEGYYPAACCCARFRTTGTYRLCDEPNLTQRVWYLPACSELGYIMPNCSVNNSAMTNIKKLYGSNVAVQFSDTNYHWSSTEYNSQRVWILLPNQGMTQSNFKKNNSSYSDFYVRAFCALPA